MADTSIFQKWKPFKTTGSSTSQTWTTLLQKVIKPHYKSIHTMRWQPWASWACGADAEGTVRSISWPSEWCSRKIYRSLGLILIVFVKPPLCCLLEQFSKHGYLLPVNAIHRAYFVASLRQWEATSKPHVTVKEMIPMMIKNRVVTHSGGSLGGMQVRSRPWIVWHCRTRPTVSAPGKMQR